ncbi:MAG TPA: Rieske (2Fe-2S) protein [Mycobacterium sp.]|nr:Rieske (2Fe-2S) protein [Mycobacterium sp.]
MNARALRRYVDDLLRGRRPKPFRPDDFEAAQIRTAIDLRAARLGGDAPREEFLTNLRDRLAAQMDGDAATTSKVSATRRQVIVGTSAAAAAAAVAVAADRSLFRQHPGIAADDTRNELVPSHGSWQVVASSADVPDGQMRPFQAGSLIGFLRRVGGRAEAVSGVCTHQGCRLWFDQADDTLRCPCHTTSFAPTGQVIAHQLPIAPKPLPQLEVREANGYIEVFAPAQPPQSS